MPLRLHFGAIIALAVLLYANTLGHDYAFDDAVVADSWRPTFGDADTNDNSKLFID